MTSGRLLARNSALNLLGHVAPLIVALAAIPPLIRGLGTERFGVLTLAWAAIGYFGVFEFGLGRALTQRVAQRVGGSGEAELSGTVRAALLFLLLSGVAGALVLAVGSRILVDEILELSGATLREETIIVFWILAATLPFVLMTSGLRGIMEGHQHFGIANALRVPSAVVSYLGPLLALPFSRSLIPAVAVIATGRVLFFGLHLLVCIRFYPYFRASSQSPREPTIALLRFGAWMTVSNVISPMMSYLDRFFVGATLGMASVTAYATPHEALMKMLVIPAALTAAAFPALASIMALNPATSSALYQRCTRAVLLVMFPIVLVAVVFAHEGLQFWVGPLLPAESASILQWLAVGVFATALGQVPATALQSGGRPDIIARLHLIELPLYATTLLMLTPRLGLIGVAITWTARCVLDAAALTWLAYRELKVLPLQRAAEGSWLVAMSVLIVLGAAMPDATTRVLFALVVGVTFAPLAWAKLITARERDELRHWLASSFARRLDRARG